MTLIPAEESGEALDPEQRALLKTLADALERAGELELFEAALLLDSKRSREELSLLLDALETEMGTRAAKASDRRRLLRAADLVRQLREAHRLNVNAGQLSGWLCAGMFETNAALNGF